jgi:GH24 family phage-related lysozyme (muramidase)
MLLTLSFASAAPAIAAANDGLCETGEFCYYYSATNAGSMRDFSSSSLPSYTDSTGSCYTFKSAGAGQGECVQNHAASVWNRTSSTVNVYYNSNYGGASQGFASNAKGDLNATLKNNNASHRTVAVANNGVCETGEFCYYYSSSNAGSMRDFSSSSLPSYVDSTGACYTFRSTGAGQGACVQNNAASVWNRTSSAVNVYYNSNYGGASQGFASNAKGDLNATLKNNNASHGVASSRLLPSQLAVSPAGLKFIADLEGFVATPKGDPGGNCTIGYGHKIRDGGCLSSDYADWGTITTSQGYSLLSKDAAIRVSQVRSSIPSTPLKQSEFDAIVSFVYNVGIGRVGVSGFNNSKVREDLVATPPQYTAVPAHLLNWAGGSCGLYKRRVNEGELFSRADYGIEAVSCPFRVTVSEDVALLRMRMHPPTAGSR